jgi:hypothetical protein
MDGYRSLRPDEQVEVEVEGPLGYLQDGCRYVGSAARPIR